MINRKEQKKCGQYMTALSRRIRYVQKPYMFIISGEKRIPSHNGDGKF